MLTEPQIKIAWEEWLGAEVRASYFADLGRTFYSRQQVATWSTLILSSGAAFGLLTKVENLPAWVIGVVSLAAAGVSLYSLVTQNAKKAADCSDLHFRWNKLAIDYRDLWMHWYDDDAETRLSRLNERGAEASKAATPAFGHDRKRMLKWEDYVIQNRVHQQAA